MTNKDDNGVADVRDRLIRACRKFGKSMAAVAKTIEEFSYAIPKTLDKVRDARYFMLHKMLGYPTKPLFFQKSRLVSPKQRIIRARNLSQSDKRLRRKGRHACENSNS